MRDILVILSFGIIMVGLITFSLNMAKGSASTAGKGISFSEWFWKMTHIEQADQAAQTIGDKRRENDSKLRDAQQALRSKMDGQRAKMDAAQDRIRAMQQRNKAQMERMRNR